MKNNILKYNRILLYHSVSYEKNFPYSVLPEEFEWQMNWLYEHGYSICTLDQIINKKEPLKKNSIVITFDDGYEDNYSIAMPILEKYSFKACFFIVTGCVGKTNVWDSLLYPEKRLMNWEQIKELSNKGHTIGCHTHTHMNMKNSDYFKVKNELIKSQLLLEENIDQNFMPIAYPYGSFSTGVINIIKKNNFIPGLTAKGFLGNTVFTNKWKLRRINIYHNTSRSDFIACVRGISDWNYFKLNFKYFINNLKHR